MIIEFWCYVLELGNSFVYRIMEYLLCVSATSQIKTLEKHNEWYSLFAHLISWWTWSKWRIIDITLLQVIKRLFYFTIVTNISYNSCYGMSLICHCTYKWFSHISFKILSPECSGRHFTLWKFPSIEILINKCSVQLQREYVWLLPLIK